jgi:serine/threonine protein kinase/CHASE2 domain-containing sensor protein
MTPDDLARMQAIFEAVVDLPVSERQKYLVEVCDGDSELRANLERLIHADDDTVTIGGLRDQVPTKSVKECSKCSGCYDTAISICPVDGARLDVAFPGPLLIDGKYLIERSLGRGGMGAVYLVKHTALEKHFALKVIATDGPIPQAFRRNFENEALALGRLKHPNIVEVTDYGVDPRRGGLPYLVMEYLEGKTVRQVLQERQWLPFPEAATMLRAAAAGIDCAHANSIIHGDLKPANLFLARQVDGTEIVKVVDFGLARLRSQEPRDPVAAVSDSNNQSTATDSIRGTIGYMAPELFKGQSASRQSDQFAFGALAFEALTGSVPFGKSLSEVRAKQRQPAPNPSASNAGLPAELDAPVLSLLEREPERRPPSASAAVAEMEAAWLCAEQRQWRERELPKRYWYALAAASIAILLAACLSLLPVVRNLENGTVDARFAIAPKHAPDPHLLGVALDEDAIAEDPRPLAQWDGKLADLMERMLDGGARGVALDLLLPASWSDSQRFARVVELHPDRVALAIFSESGKLTGTECIGPLTEAVIGQERYLALFGFANLEEDGEGRIRKGRAAYSDLEGRVRATLATRAVTMASLAPSGFIPRDRAEWIDYSVSPRDIPRISWSEASAIQPAFFNGKLVIIGEDFPGSNDRHHLPATVDPDRVPGMVIQAMIANTIARGFPVHDPGLPACLALMSMACFGTIALALRFPHKPAWTILAAATLFSGYTLAALGIFRIFRTMLVLVSPEIGLLLSVIIAWQLRARLAHYPLKGA